MFEFREPEWSMHELRRKYVRNTALLCIPLMLLFACANVIEGDYALLGIAELILASTLLPLTLLLAEREKNIQLAETSLLTFGLATCFVLSLLGAKAGSGVLWLFAFPSLALFTAGLMRGIHWCFAWIVVNVVGMLLAQQVAFGYAYSNEFIIQSFCAMSFYVAVAMLQDHARTRFERGLQGGAASHHERAQSYLERLRYVATHDTLTGFPNRTRICEIIDTEIADLHPEKEKLAVVYIKLERMFEMSNVLGIAGSDDLVCSIAETLKAVIGAKAILAKTGRDEFVCVYQTTTSSFAEHDIVQKVSDFQVAYTVSGYPIHIEHTLGIAVFPDHGEDSFDLLRKAEQAMLQAKARQTNLGVYDPGMDQRFVRRHLLYGQLRHALETESLQLHYQGQVDMRTGMVTGVEAMARWHDGEEGWIAPNEFIPVAESSGLIKPYTSWMLGTAFAELKKWHQAGLKTSLSVNISARSLVDPELVDELEDMLDRHGVEPQWVVLELTESCFAEFPELAMRTIDCLNRIGFRQSIDDFGTGYSSLSYLKDLKVDELKIDRSFVADLERLPGSEAIVRTTIQLAHNLGLSVVAEGIERREIHERLMAMGCDVGQGYWYSRPVPPEQFMLWAKAWNARSEAGVVQYQ